MAQIMNNKNRNALYNVAITTLGTLSFLCLFGIAGNYDLRDQMLEENARLGYEKHKEADIPTDKDSAKAGAISVASFLGALALYKKKQNVK